VDLEKIYTGPKKAPHFGEDAFLVATQSQIDNTNLRRKVRATLGTTARSGPVPAAASKGAPEAKR
jgi:hypothetical protein